MLRFEVALSKNLWKKIMSQPRVNWSKTTHLSNSLFNHSFKLYTHNSFFPNNTVQNHRILPAALRGFASEHKFWSSSQILGSNSKKRGGGGGLISLQMGVYVSDEVDAAAVTKSSVSWWVWRMRIFSSGTSHSVSREDCSSLRVLRLVFRSSITGLLFPLGVRHSMSSRVSWVSWSVRTSLVTTLSKFSVLGWPSQRSRSKSTWRKWKKLLVSLLHPTIL